MGELFTRRLSHLFIPGGPSVHDHPFSTSGLEVSPELANLLAKQGINAPTAVQAAAIGLLLKTQDAVIQSGTGSGKTLAYLLPLLQRARADASFLAVIIAPSPELA